MSYCHLTDYGVNFNNGFGIQPGDLIRNQIASNGCIVSCDDPQVCEDNVVNNIQVVDNFQDYTISWSSSYAVKIYRRSDINAAFEYVTTIDYPNNSYALNYLGCNQREELKIVSICTNGDSKPSVIVIEPRKDTKLNYTGEINLCDNYQGDAILLNVMQPDSFNTFQWVHNGNIIDGAASHSYTANELGTYSCLTTTPSGCNYETNALLVTEQIPSSAFSYSKTGLNTVFINESSCSNQPTWDFGDSISSGNNNPTHQYPIANYYNVCLSSMNLAGSDQLCKSIPVFDKWIDNMNNVTDGIPYNATYDDSQCDRAVKFTRNSGSDYSQNTHIQFPFENWIPKQGTLEFLIKVSNGSTFNGTSNTTASIFSVGNQSYSNSSFLSVYSNGKITIRRYQSPGFTDVTAVGTPFTFNQWHVVSVSYGSAGTKIAVDGTVYINNTSVNFDMNTGITTLGHINFEDFNNLWYGFEGLVDKFRISYSQNDFQLTANGNLSAPTITQVGDNLYSSSPENNQWYLNGIAVSGATNQMFTATGDGIYKVEVSSPFGCPSVFSDDFTIGPLSIGVNEVGGFGVYPNPFNSCITISSPKDLIKSVTVFDLMGRKIKSEEHLNSIKAEIYLENLPEAIYMVEIITDTATEKVKVCKK